MQEIFKQEYAGTVNTVFAVDEPGSGNGCHLYQAVIETGDDRLVAEIDFQKGSALEVGINGVQNEHLLAIIIHRLQGFQAGPFSCQENALALTRLQEAMHCLEARTKDRANRGVEGKNEA